VSKKKPKALDGDKRVRKLEKVAADKDRPKKERKAAQAELDALRGAFVPIGATGDDTAEPSSPSTDADGRTTSPEGSAPGADGSIDDGPLRAKQDAEVARQWAHFKASDPSPMMERARELDATTRKMAEAASITIVGALPTEAAEAGAKAEGAEAILALDDPSGIAADLIVEDVPDAYRLEAPIPFERIVVGEDGVIRFRLADVGAPVLEPVAEEEGKAGEPIRVNGDGTVVSGNIVQEAVEVETEQGREFAVGPAKPDAPVLEKPADPVLENGNGQPMIHYRDPATGREKVKGYTRVTTYIDCLDDKTVLNAWKARVLLEGGAVELLQNDGTSPSLEAVARSVKRTDEALADIDRRTRLEGELLELRRQEVQKEHRDVLARIGEDLLELGGAHEKANKGTDLHLLTELVDNGKPLPEGTTASDRRDIDAYQRAMAALDAKVLWTERRVVLDDIQVSGTMDRALLVKLPGMGRRIRVVADVKTGNITFAPGKIGMQLALYARGLGYDWTKPLDRERLSLSTHHGLLIHLPQGEGRCAIYLVDLELAGTGLSLARAVREWRNTAKRLFDVKSPLEAVEVGAAEVEAEEVA
jgi:hypothetical protein